MLAFQQLNTQCLVNNNNNNNNNNKIIDMSIRIVEITARI